MKRLATGLIVILAAGPSFGLAQTTASPNLVVEQHGDVTDLSVEGQLAPTRSLDCIALADVQAAFTPPDLYTGVARCVDRGHYDAAVRLSATALAFARFDAERVADASARDAGQMIAYRYGGSLSADQRASFAPALKRLLSDPAGLRALCDRLARLGPPDYVPTYMIRHGAEFAARSLNHLPEPATGSFVPGFDATAAWDRVRKTYLHCS